MQLARDAVSRAIQQHDLSAVDAFLDGTTRIRGLNHRKPTIDHYSQFTEIVEWDRLAYVGGRPSRFILSRALGCRELLELQFARQPQLQCKRSTIPVHTSSPGSFIEFELALSELVRELGRLIVEQAVNGLERGTQRRQVIYRGLG